MVRCWLAITLVGTAAACAMPRAETPRPATGYDAAVAGAMTAHELSHGAAKEIAYGWHLEVVGDRIKYFACSAEDACTSRRVELPKEALVAMQAVSRTHPELDDGTKGEEVEVLRLTLARELTTTRGGVSSDGRGIVVQ